MYRKFLNVTFSDTVWGCISTNSAHIKCTEKWNLILYRIFLLFHFSILYRVSYKFTQILLESIVKQSKKKFVDIVLQQLRRGGRGTHLLRHVFLCPCSFLFRETLPFYFCKFCIRSFPDRRCEYGFGGFLNKDNK